MEIFCTEFCPNRKKTDKNTDKIWFTLLSGAWLSIRRFSRNSWLTNSTVISNQGGQEILGSSRTNSFMPLSVPVTVASLTSLNSYRPGNFFAKNPSAEFHENPASCLVADTRSGTDRHAERHVVSTQGILFLYFAKKAKQRDNTWWLTRPSAHILIVAHYVLIRRTIFSDRN